MSDRIKRAAALGVATIAMSAGVVLGTVGSASAATAYHGPDRDHARHGWQDQNYWNRGRHLGHHKKDHRQFGQVGRAWRTNDRDCRR
ncbi:hypothetical protein [Streptomyces chiangmaiensis]|uniref:Lipoprotein n=1 Tax=Streptomyces chiangmaiensis TaxID=766497 RepID=A0ABU7FPH1_9ACTN|nr:hypothetical protein [Streptomyces chiangmaiensis]MED7824979.1 hypothetical protein [Streptomyces chiangmaiensis]